jgi:hypothetical protein
MSWMTADGETGRTVWRDRTAVRARHEAVTRLVNGEWVTVDATRPTMVSWRAGSSRVVES